MAQDFSYKQYSHTMDNSKDIPSLIISMEYAALDRWIHGDLSGFLEICAPDIVYFDPYREKRVDGLEDLTALYKELWGKVLLDRFEPLNPLVQVIGDAAVLTFNYISYAGEAEYRWNCRKCIDGTEINGRSSKRTGHIQRV